VRHPPCRHCCASVDAHADGAVRSALTYWVHIRLIREQLCGDVGVVVRHGEVLRGATRAVRQSARANRLKGPTFS
jgi:hypothetical protein